MFMQVRRFALPAMVPISFAASFNQSYQLASAPVLHCACSTFNIPLHPCDSESDSAVVVKSDRIRSKAGLWWKVGEDLPLFAAI
jgi:hypothetical protein